MYVMYVCVLYVVCKNVYIPAYNVLRAPIDSGRVQIYVYMCI